MKWPMPSPENNELIRVDPFATGTLLRILTVMATQTSVSLTASATIPAESYEAMRENMQAFVVPICVAETAQRAVALQPTALSHHTC